MVSPLDRLKAAGVTAPEGWDQEDERWNPDPRTFAWHKWPGGEEDPTPYPAWVTNPAREWYQQLNSAEREYFVGRESYLPGLLDLRDRLDAAVSQMPDELRAMFRIETATVKEGVLLTSRTRPHSQLIASDQDVGWENVLLHSGANNPETGKPFRTWAQMVVHKIPSWWEIQWRGDKPRRVQKEWHGMHPLDAERRMRQLTDYLRGYGFTFYNLTGSGVENVTFYGTVDEDAPPPERYDHMKAIGDWHPFMYDANGHPMRFEWVNPSGPGKISKRYKADSAGGYHTYAERDSLNPNSIHLVDPKNTNKEAHIQMLAVEDVASNFRDADGNELVGTFSNTDGGGAVRHSAFLKIAEVVGHEVTGLESQIQTLGIIDRFDNFDGWNDTGVQKDLVPIIPDKVFTTIVTEYLIERRGFDPKEAERLAPYIDYLTSTEGAANQLSNGKVDRLRFLIHNSHPDYLDHRSVSGTAKQPMLHRWFDLAKLADLHFEGVAKENYDALFKSRRYIQDLQQKLKDQFPDGLDEAGKLERNDPRYLKRWRAQQRILAAYQSNEYAVQIGNRFAGPGIMSLSNTGPASRFRARRNNPKSLADLDLPVMSAKATPMIALKGWLVKEPLKKGEIAVVTEIYHAKDGTLTYTHFVGFSDEDLANPEHNWRHQGFDFDDEFKIQLAINEYGDYFIMLDRAPHGIASGALYRARPQDVKAMLAGGMKPMQLRPEHELAMSEYGDYKVDSLVKLEQESKFVTEEYDSNTMRRIAWDMEHGNPREAFFAKLRYAGIVTGESYVAIMYNYSALIMRSGWVDKSEDLPHWIMMLSNALDQELVGTGNNRNMSEMVAEAIVYHILDTNAKVDRQVLEGQFRQERNLLANAYATIKAAREDGIELKDIVDSKERNRERRKYQKRGGDSRGIWAMEWNNLVAERKITLPRWQEVNKRVEAGYIISDRTEKLLHSMSNGPLEWLSAVERFKKPARMRRKDRWIHRDVMKLARDVSVKYAQILTIQHRWEEELEWRIRGPDPDIEVFDVDGRQIYPNGDRTEWYENIVEDAHVAMWRKVDRIVEVANAEARNITGYEDGMFQAALVSEELRRNNRRNLEPGTTEYRSLANRLYQAIDRRDKAGYWHPDLTYGPMLIIPWQTKKGRINKPWMQLNRKTGEHYDARVTGREYIDKDGNKQHRRREFSNIRYHPEENILGPPLWPELQDVKGMEVYDPKSGVYRDLLSDLNYLGYSFQYTGHELQHRHGMAIYFVRHSDEYTEYTPEQFERWAYARYVLKYSPDILPPPWITSKEIGVSPDGYITWQNASGKRVRVDIESKRIRVGLWDNQRTEFKDLYSYYAKPENYEDVLAQWGVELPDADVARARRAEREWMQSIDAMVPDDADYYQPLPDTMAEPDWIGPPPDLPPPTPIDDLEMPMPDEMAWLDDQDIDRGRVMDAVRDYEDRYTERVGQHQRVKPPPDPRIPTEVAAKEPVTAVTRVGGQYNDESKLLAYFEEFRRHHVDVIPDWGDDKEGRAQVFVKSSRATDKQRVLDTQGSFGINAIFESPTLGMFTTSREAAGAYEDYSRFKRGARGQFRTPGLELAKDSNEAASLILKRLFLQSELRLIINDEIGYFYYDQIEDEKGNEKWIRKHNKDKTDFLHRRVALKANLFHIPTSIAGVGVSVRHEIRSYRRVNNRIERLIYENSYYDPKPVLGDYWDEMGWTDLAKQKGYPKKYGTGTLNPDTGERHLNTEAFLQDLRIEQQEVDQRNLRKAGRVEFLKKWIEIDNKGLQIGKDGINLVDHSALVYGGRRRDDITDFIIPPMRMAQLAAELEDVRLDMKDLYRAHRRAWDTFDDDELFTVLKLTMAEAVRKRFSDLGVNMEPSLEALFRNDPDQVRTPPTAGEAFRQSYLGYDYEAIKSISSNFFNAAAAGDWTKANIELKRLPELNATKFVRRNTRFYSQVYSDLTVLRSLGRFLVGGQALGGQYYLDLDSAFGGREVSDMVRETKKAAGNLLWDGLKSFDREWYRTARNAYEKYKDVKYDAKRKLSIDLDLLNDTSEANIQRSMLKAQRTLIIIRVNWWQLLTAGIGARYLAKAMRKKNVPLEKRSIVKEMWDTDRLCAGNAGQGWIRNDQDFRSGHPEPPYHPGCRCKIKLRVAQGADRGVQNVLNRTTKPQFVNVGRRRRFPRTRRNPVFGGVLQ